MFPKMYAGCLIFLLFVLQNSSTQSKETSPVEVEVVIVGAGAAGLHAAHRLIQNGIKSVVVLEAQERVGGRIYSRGVNNNWIELGAQWIHGQGENPLWKFCLENNIPMSPITGDAGGGYHMRDDGERPPGNVHRQTLRFMETIRESCDEIKGGSIGDFFQAKFDNWSATVEPVDQQSKDWRNQIFRWWLKVEQFDAACDNFYNQSAISYCEFDDISPDTNFLNGYQSLLNVYLDFLNKNDVKIHLNTPVNNIKWQNDNGKVLVTTNNGKSFESNFVIVTASLGYLQKHHGQLFSPQLPEEKVKVIKGLRMGTSGKIFLEFEEPFWTEDDYGFPFLWSSDATMQEYNEKDWFQYILGFDVIINQPNFLVGWISGPAAKYVETLSDKEIEEGIIGNLTILLREWYENPEFNLTTLKQLTVTRWHSNPYTLGSYSYREVDSDDLGITHSDLGKPLIHKDIAKVLFAGEATTDEYYSAVHSAIESAEREVDRIVEIIENNSANLLISIKLLFFCLFAYFYKSY